jgi:hypothetical protein
MTDEFRFIRQSQSAMTRKREEPHVGRVSPESLRRATGRAWTEWLEALDAAGAANWEHKEIVAHLERDHTEVDSNWWRQSIAVGYARARRKRAVGETAAAGFQVGVQRAIDATATEAPKAGARETMRKRWREALERIATAAS